MADAATARIRLGVLSKECGGMFVVRDEVGEDWAVCPKDRLVVIYSRNLQLSLVYVHAIGLLAWHYKRVQYHLDIIWDITTEQFESLRENGLVSRPPSLSIPLTPQRLPPPRCLPRH